MRSILVSTVAGLTLSLVVFIQQGGAQQDGKQQAKGPKNLKMLQPQNFRTSMDVFTSALGVQCTFCHVQGVMDSDDKPQKATARMMLQMTREINEKFGDGKVHVRCYTCHRGSPKPLTEAAK